MRVYLSGLDGSMPEGLLDDSGIGFSHHSGGKGMSEVVGL